MSDGRERDTTGEFGSGENGVDSGDEEYGGPQDRPVDESGGSLINPIGSSCYLRNLGEFCFVDSCISLKLVWTITFPFF